MQHALAVRGSGRAGRKYGMKEGLGDKQTHSSRHIHAGTYTQAHTSRLVEPETLRDRQAHLRLC